MIPWRVFPDINETLSFFCWVEEEPSQKFAKKRRVVARIGLFMFGVAKCCIGTFSRNVI